MLTAGGCFTLLMQVFKLRSRVTQVKLSDETKVKVFCRGKKRSRRQTFCLLTQEVSQPQTLQKSQCFRCDVY